jgi:hypothetical protein
VYDAVRQRKTLFVDGEPAQAQDTLVAPNLTQPFDIGPAPISGTSLSSKARLMMWRSLKVH